MFEMYMPALKNRNTTKKTSYFFNYSGHGGMHEGMTEAVLDKKPGTSNSTFPVE